MSVAAASWLGLGAFLLEHVGGVKIVVFGDPLLIMTPTPTQAQTDGEKKERALVISNHRTRIDWMFLWCLYARIGQLNAYRVILKHELKEFPWWGWGMSLSLFAFIRRGSKYKDTALERVAQICDYFLQLDLPNLLLIFPEGTDLSESNQKRDKEFARQKGLPPYNHVLHPRSGAFKASFGGHLDVVYDLTMSYVDFVPGERPSELSLLRGRLPREVHIHVKRHEVEQEPLLRQGTLESLEEFLRNSFDEKEKMLADVYKAQKEGKGTDNSVSPSLQECYDHHARRAYAWGTISTLAACASVVVLAKYLGPLLFWSLAVGGALVFVVVNKFLDGFDTLELRLPVLGMEKRRKEREREEENAKEK